MLGMRWGSSINQEYPDYVLNENCSGDPPPIPFSKK